MAKLFFLLLLTSTVALVQESSLYNNHWQLLIDESYTIDSVTYHHLALIEKDLLPRIYNNVKYPARPKYNNVNGMVIVKLLINGNNYSYNIVKSTGEDFTPQVLLSFKNLSSHFSMRSPFPQNEKLLVYIPIKFEIMLQRYQKTLKQNHMITIEFNELAPENSEGTQDRIITPKKP